MNYSEAKAMFSSILNRQDITASQINDFFTLGAQRVQRKIRIPPLEKTVEFSTDGTRVLEVPGDYLNMIAMYTDDDVGNTNKLIRADLGTVLRESKVFGTPRYYHRSGADFWIGPVPAENTSVFMQYYADPTALSADTDENWLTLSAPSLLVYSALLYASDYFLDDRKPEFQKTFMEDLEDVAAMAERDEYDNASMQPVAPGGMEGEY